VAYDNNSDKITFISKTGSEITSNNYIVDISSLLDSTTQLGTSLSDQDEFMVVRKFDASSISPSITAAEAWSAWTLPNTNTSGSTMYSLSQSNITFSQTAADYTWTTTHSGRAAAIVLPVIAAADTIYILRKTYNIQKLINWTTGSKITSSSLNLSSDQLLFLSQELMTLWHNFHTMNPSVGQPDGICPLNSSGVIASTYLGATASVGDGIEGDGSASSPIKIDLAGTDGDASGLAFSSGDLKADTVDSVTSTDVYKPLSANQGKLLQDQITGIGTSIVYKGAHNLNTTTETAAVGTDSPTAGWTVTQSTTGVADASWTGLSGSIAAGTVIRFGGTNWEVVSATTAVLADGSVALNTAQKAVTQAPDEGDKTDGEEKSVATVEYVEDAIVNTKLSELSDVIKSNATATVTITDVTELNNGDKVNLIAADTTSHDFTVGDVAGGGTWIAEVDNDTSATNLKLQIDANAKFSATVSGAVVTITQATAGANGNTAITLTDSFTAGMTKTDFTGGATGTAPVAGNLVYYDGDTWETVALKTTVPTGTVLTTADNIADLADVGTTSPSSSEALVWDGDSWEPTAIAGLTSLMVVCGGDGDGTGDESDHVDDAFNDSTLGHQGDPGSTTLSLCEFRGRTHKIGDGADVAQPVEIPYKQDITYRNGTFNFDLSDTYDQYVIRTRTDATTLSTTTTAAIEWMAKKIIVSDETGFYEGDYIQLIADTDDPRSVMFDDNTDKYYGLLITKIVGIQPDTNTIVLADPVPFAAAAGVTVSRTGATKDAENGKAQLKNITFENIKLRDIHHDVVYLGSSPVEMLAVNDTTVTVDLPAGHDMRVGGVIRLQDVDASNGELLVGDQYDTINNQFAITAITDTNTATFTLANSGECGVDGNVGGLYPVMQISSHNGILIEYGHNIVFRNCTFDGFNNFAVNLARCKNVLFDNCTFLNTNGLGFYDAAIRISECDGVTIRNCTFENCCTCVLVAASASYSSRNIQITNNTMSYTDCGVYIDAYIHDNFDFKDNYCTVVAFNPNRIHQGRQLTTSVRAIIAAVYNKSAIYSCNITNNVCSNLIRQPVVGSWEEDKFWGWGDGIEYSTQGGNLADEHMLPGHEYGFRIGVSAYQDSLMARYVETVYRGRTATSSYNISDNTITALKGAIATKMWWNHTNSTEVTSVSGIRINNNTISWTHIGISFLGAHTNKFGHGQHIQIFDAMISHNQINMISHVMWSASDVSGYWGHLPGKWCKLNVEEEGYRGTLITDVDGQWHNQSPQRPVGLYFHQGFADEAGTPTQVDDLRIVFNACSARSNHFTASLHENDEVGILMGSVGGNMTLFNSFDIIYNTFIDLYYGIIARPKRSGINMLWNFFYSNNTWRTSTGYGAWSADHDNKAI